MNQIKYSCLLLLLCWIIPVASMDEFIGQELDFERDTQIIKKLGGKDICDKILAQWSSYEKRFLVTMLNEPKWPAHRIGASVSFAKCKEIYRDRFLVLVNNKQITVTMDDFKVLAELHHVPVFASYNAETLKFDDLRKHFDTEDEIWEQLDRQLNRGK